MDREENREICTLPLAPSCKLSVQVHRETLQFGEGKTGWIQCRYLPKSNAPQILQSQKDYKHGLYYLVSTPLRLCYLITKGLELRGVRMVVLDECDRLLDASKRVKGDSKGSNPGSGSSASGGSQSPTFVM